MCACDDARNQFSSAAAAHRTLPYLIVSVSFAAYGILLCSTHHALIISNSNRIFMRISSRLAYTPSYLMVTVILCYPYFMCCSSLEALNSSTSYRTRFYRVVYCLHVDLYHRQYILRLRSVQDYIMRLCVPKIHLPSIGSRRPRQRH